MTKVGRFLVTTAAAAMVTALPNAASADNRALLLFDGEKGEIFAGCLNCTKYSQNAICNKYGTFGSKYNQLSIWNRYGEFGSKYNSNSPWNKYGQGLRIVDESGNYYGKFSMSKSEQSKIPFVVAILSLFEADVDLDDIRDKFCD